MKVILQVFKVGFVILLITMMLIVVISRITGNEPSFLGYQMKNVLSGSMEPVFMTGSVIQIKKTEHEGTEYDIDDIITFQKENKLITHRVVGKVINDREVLYTTQGDNNDGIDSTPVSASQIIGHYTGLTIPYIGYLLKITDTRLGSMLLLVVPGVMLVGFAVQLFIKQRRLYERQKT
ncbi:signal peptidase I SipW [Jeotgalibacillus sp. R-1-5s-1]|uniref:signal peptidase I SipW n=1 Tax=Jeotgalibacillus sp. R-1-5s-1 TaxID=2555897 RepID=UPI00106B2133|nr:signal peptidase I [Jeotgalibacillus sp. R-1-5s-1]TFD97089.1 signal peptidase I [Jeotgalibacillus sp. R-1-5s-1]